MSAETETPAPRYQWPEADAQLVIEYESTLDTLIESSEISRTNSYPLLRAALNQLQRELEADGVKGKWRTWPDNKEAA